MNFGTIVQARMSSNRFPGKVLHEILNKPLLLYLIERLQHGVPRDSLVVATSREESDDKIFSFCMDRNIPCHRGSLNNVAERFLDITEQYHLDAFIRINGDSPLIDQNLVRQALDLYGQAAADMVTNVFPRSFPKGQSVEILNSRVFRASYPLFKDSEDYEHVTRFFYKNSEKYRIINFTSKKDLSNVQLSVDTREDMSITEQIIARMTKPHWEYGMDDIMILHRQVAEQSPL